MLSPPPSSSSSSSSANELALLPFLIPPNAALPPASENGDACTAVPKTLAFAGALKEPKSETTLRCAEVGERVGEEGVMYEVGAEDFGSERGGTLGW